MKQTITTTATQISSPDAWWAFEDVPKLVRKYLSERFSRDFKVRRNKRRERITAEWELGPTSTEVASFLCCTFPHLHYRRGWETARDEECLMDGLWLEPLFYHVKRIDLFNAAIEAIPHLIEAGANIDERDARGYSPFDRAVLNQDETRAIALLEAGADCHSCLPGGDLYEARLCMPALWAEIEWRLIDCEIDGGSRTASRRHRI